MMYVAQNAGRIARGLLKFVGEKAGLIRRDVTPICAPTNEYGGSLSAHHCANLLLVGKATERVLAYLRAVRKLEVANVSLDDLCDMEPKEIGQLLRHKRIGERVTACASYVPYLHLEVEVQPLTRTVLRVNIDVCAAYME